MVNESERTSNRALRALIAEAGCTYASLARSVNAVGAEAGVGLRYAKPSVAQWLDGARPREPLFVAEALARRLGRPVPLSDIGMGPSDADPGVAPDWDRLDPATALADLGSIVNRRTLITMGPYSLAAAWRLPDWEEIADRGALVATASASTAASGPRIGVKDVEAVRAMTNMFCEVDDAHGSGQVRETALAYLGRDVAGFLRADAPGPVRRELHRAASMLAYIVGWYHWDSELHVPAQRLYGLALRLAAAADDGPGYATVLRGMSVQAGGLGHHGTAVHLAEQAVTAAGGVGAQPLHRAFVMASLAAANGGRRDRRSALAALTATEHALHRADTASGPTGGFHVASFEHTIALTCRGLGDVRAGAAAMVRSNRARPASERRHRAVSSGILAELLLDLGRLDEACAAWADLLADREHLRCGQVDTAVATMRAKLRPHARVPAASALLDRARPPGG
ncbi:hypothetical protein [Streptomyces sp. SID3343]|uniref:hypothetical protein n=1 Tax=Streptomyces sp. SID3343 TaxID=2690260 RepID=UPI001367CDD9|nr:hypothetical protein [Streptomyces sp. SID3343]MYV97707.1 hypothetical protein [Streptomyces sp. SID3343]